MDSWMNCPECNDKLVLFKDELFPFYCRKCNEIYDRVELELFHKKEQESKRLAAVRSLVLEYGAAESPAIEALAAVWPEAVEGVR